MKVSTRGCIRHTQPPVRPYKDLIAVEIDLKAKRAEVDATSSSGDGVPGVIVGAQDGTLHTVGDRKMPTHFEFPEFRGYDIVATSVSRYTLTVVFGKVKSQAEFQKGANNGERFEG